MKHLQHQLTRPSTYRSPRTTTSHTTTSVVHYVRYARSRIMACVAVLCTILAVAGCSTAASTPSSEPAPSNTPVTPITVVASLSQWGALAAAIGGKYVQVTSVISEPNTELSQAKPTADQITAIGKAKVVVMNGAGLDTWMQRYASDEAALINAAQTVGAGKGDNPYLWFSSDVRKAMAQELVSEFSHIDSAHKSYYAKQLRTTNRAEADITAIYTKLQDLAKNATTDTHMTYCAVSPIAQYLMSDAHFTDATPQNIQQAVLTGDTLSTEDVTQLQSMIESRKVQVLVRTTAPSEAAMASANQLGGIAGRSGVTLFDISPVMPKDSQSLAAWIQSLAQQLEHIASYNTQTDADGNPSHDGQTDPNDTGNSSTSGNTNESQSNQTSTDQTDDTIPSNEGQPNPR